jgi:hypothetical protein
MIQKVNMKNEKKKKKNNITYDVGNSVPCLGQGTKM